MSPAPPLAAPLPPTQAPAPAPPREGRLARLIAFGLGGVGLLVSLAVLASVPVLQFMTLGWLLEAEGRLARGGRLRDVLPGWRKAARVGSIAIGCGTLAIPWLILGSFQADATLVAPGSELAATLELSSLALGALLATHGLLAVARGGRLRHFVRPLNNVLWLARRAGREPGTSPGELLRGARRFAAELRLGHYLTLGVQGFLAGLGWLFLPTALLVLARVAPPLGLLGLLLLPLALPWTLVAQAHLAREGELRAAFRIGALYRTMRRAPLAVAFAVLVTLALAFPLHAFKVEALPRDALWLPALVFLVALYPTRLLAGWACARGSREGKAHWGWRLTGVALTLPACGAYVFLLFFTQYFGWRGTAGLFANHAFLLPVAFY